MKALSCSINSWRPSWSRAAAVAWVLGGSVLSIQGAPDASTALSAARANAKHALSQAIEELQKSAGPDQRITARAEILNEDMARPFLTGVWRSWEIDAKSPPDFNDYEKDSKFPNFVSWLISNPDIDATRKVGFADQPPLDPVTLLGAGSLGGEALASQHVLASKVMLPSTEGGFAWAVLDEGVKARINTPFVDEAPSIAAKTMQLGSGKRPATEFLPGLEGLERDYFEAGSSSYADMVEGIGTAGFSPAAEQLSPGAAAALKALAHDVTLHSMGLFTNTAEGGLKEDFNLLSDESRLPQQYQSQGVYETLLGIDVPSDPKWESLTDFAGLHNDGSRLVSSDGQPVVRASVPSRWRASVGSSVITGERGAPDLSPPPGVVLMPVIERVQMFFSLMSRDIYRYPKISDTTPKVAGSVAQERASSLVGPWGVNYAGSAYDYFMSLAYTPVVTLRNPYNVTLEVRDLKVVFGNVPFAMQIIRNGVEQTTGLAPLDTLYYQQAEYGRVPKRFGMSLRTNGGTSANPRVGSSTLRLLPGEVMTFSPYFDPRLSFLQSDIFSDWRNGNDLTMDIEAIPGFRGEAIGYYADWLCPAPQRVSSVEVEGARSMDRGGTIAARAEDEFSVRFAPLSVPDLSENKFAIELFAQVDGGRQVSAGVIEMDYGTPTGLQDSLMGPGEVITFPGEGTINTMEMHVHSATPLKDVYTVKPFAMVNVHAKTTHGGNGEDSLDGRLAAKPGSFAHSNVGSSVVGPGEVAAANASHEFDIRRLDSGIDEVLPLDPEGRGVGVTGQSALSGISFGAQYDIPLGPLQTLGGLNASNPGGSSGYYPRFAQPVGNSWAHPMLDPAEVTTPGESYALADHSFLLNLALYDRFYFSGLSDETGTFGSGETTEMKAGDFAAGGYLDDPRIILYRPHGKRSSELVGEVSSEDGYARIAAWQMMKGAFNVNSTSVPAWKAMLASIHDSSALENRVPYRGAATLTELSPGYGASRVSRFRLPVSLRGQRDPKYSYWLGSRGYPEHEIQQLAEAIVEQVRLRGPFLSMAEFVNRRLGEEFEPLGQSGALQAAIDRSEINDSEAFQARAGYEIPASAVVDHEHLNPTAATGPSYQGAPGYLTQADLLNVLGNAATVRSDTFVIRCYGEKTEDGVTTTAVGEAVVQRLPDWYDSSEAPETHPSDLGELNNRNLGRGFRMTAFRWLSDEEI